MSFIQDLKKATPAQGQIALFWFGQAGFVIKTASGRVIGIDPYFTDYVLRSEKLLGFKRLTPPPCSMDEIVFDDLLISHEHGDHFDADAIETLISNGKTRVYTNSVCADKMNDMGLDMSRVTVLKKNVTLDLGEFKLTAMDCDHGALAPEALGFMIDFGFERVYYAGDTAPSWDRLAEPMRIKPEIAILPINGAYGNLNGTQAAEYAGKLGCKVCIPCHFWTFPLHHGDPQEIIDCIGDYAPDCKLQLFYQGEGAIL